MGKVNKNIRMKAKAAVSKAATATNNIKTKIQNVGKKDDTGVLEDKLLLTKTPTKKKAITKREKVRQKHKHLMNKFALIKKQRKDEAARKNREKTAVIGDLKPLKDALPSLDELFKLSKQSDSKTGIKDIDEPTSKENPKDDKKLNVKQKLKKKKEKFVRQVSSYQALLKDPDFKKNPRDAISYHIKYTRGLIDE
ncbi:ribosome biogenesis protein SLX9 homolog [Bactrocera dorsalis]|uniref:Ribosome biogenesis protein SLX9 homolog n=1 Tax=Bactrocera dorsalis TaxID=27457 RepID=A0A6I9VPQ4_BACDO|nr:ribosome biogenesis protein SLX9 homolog [Bactrocera dorsalis]